MVKNETNHTEESAGASAAYLSMIERKLAVAAQTANEGNALDLHVNAATALASDMKRWLA